MKIVWRLLKKLKIELPYDPAIPLLGIYPKKWKQTKSLSRDEWVKKMWHIYTMEYYVAFKKKEILPFGTIWMNQGTLC